MKMPKTTADVPPVIAGDYAKMRQPSAVAQATGDGYTTTKTMNPAKARPSQFGLPKSGKGMKTSSMKVK